MEQDFLDAFLADDADLDKFYPGSKRERRTQIVSASTPVEDAWDAHPIRMRLGGGEVDLFPIGALSQALSRPVVTLRRWERMGYIPVAPYRFRDSVQPDGSRVPGRRLYSRALIEAAVAAFTSRGLMDKPRVDWNRHTSLPIELLEEWRKIHASETALS